MLAGEREGSLYYLVTAPVSRKDIIISKFIWMAGNYNDYVYYQPVFIAVQVLRPVQYSIAEVMDWWLITTVATGSVQSGLLVACIYPGVGFVISINHGGYYGFAHDVDHHIQAGI